MQALGQVAIDFDPAAHTLEIHELAIWRKAPADGPWEKRALADRKIFLLRQREQQLEQQMLNGRVSLVALLEDVRMGDAIDLAWTLTPRDQLPGLCFTAYYPFAFGVPTARCWFTLHHPGSQVPPFRLHAPREIPLPEVEPRRTARNGAWRIHPC
ncbi:MAG: DUF3857 domain-containing protein [Chthoniobacteraceae bacterium]